MASYHCSVKAVKRSAGRSATAAAAYRSGERILDVQTGEIHDYTKKQGVLSADIVVPENAPAWAQDRSKLWNAVEKAETRVNSQVAREWEIGLPKELTQDQRRELAMDYAKSLSQKYGIAVDVACHRPNTVTDNDLKKNPNMYWEIDPVDGRRHNGNWHAHLLGSTRKLEAEGFTSKTRQLDDKITGPANVLDDRARLADMQNAKLKEHGHDARVDHRSHADRGLEVEPLHRIPSGAFQFERRTGEKSRFTIDREEFMDRLAAAKALGEQERAAAPLSISQQLQSVETSIQTLIFDRAKLQLELGSEALRKAQDDKRAAERTEAAKRLEMSLEQKLMEPFVLRPLPSVKDMKVEERQKDTLKEMLANQKLESWKAEYSITQSLARSNEQRRTPAQPDDLATRLNAIRERGSEKERAAEEERERRRRRGAEREDGR